MRITCFHDVDVCSAPVLALKIFSSSCAAGERDGQPPTMSSDAVGDGVPGDAVVSTDATEVDGAAGALMSEFHSLLFSAGGVEDALDDGENGDALLGDPGGEEAMEVVMPNLVHKHRSALARCKDLQRLLQMKQLQVLMRRLGVPCESDGSDVGKLLADARRARLRASVHLENARCQAGQQEAERHHRIVLEQLDTLVSALDEDATESSASDGSDEDEAKAGTTLVNQTLQRYAINVFVLREQVAAAATPRAVSVGPVACRRCASLGMASWANEDYFSRASSE